jgi:hypothetical protein
LSAYFNSEESRGILIERLFNNKRNLKEFLLLEDFTNGTFQDIVGKIMERSLTKPQLDETTRGGQRKKKTYGKYDKFAGIIKLYQKDPKILIKILLLQKTNRKSQLKFEIEISSTEELKMRIGTHNQINKILEDFDKTENDEWRSKYIDWFEIDGDFYLYFIREFKRSMAFKLETTNFDTVCEWIIFRIPKELDQVRVSYDSNLDITKFIPAILDIKGKKEAIQKFEKYNDKETVKSFFKVILKDEYHPLVEIRFELAPFAESPTLILSDNKNNPLTRTIQWFKEHQKDLFGAIDIIKECKIYFNNHRVELKFRHEEEGIAINYLDNTLFIEQRKEFEKFMKEEFKLEVIPGGST